MSRKKQNPIEIEFHPLLERMKILARAFNGTKAWSCYCQYCAEMEAPREKLHIGDLDETFTDHPPFAGNEMRRFRTELERRGLDPTFRTILEMGEIDVQSILSLKQVGYGATELVAEIRDINSFWHKAWLDERDKRVKL